MLYKVYILFYFIYCFIVWMYCGKIVLDKFEKLNKWVLRLIFNDNVNIYIILLEIVNMFFLYDRRV